MDHALTVAVTGPTGTLGRGLLPLLTADDRVDGVVGISRGGAPAEDVAAADAAVEYRRGDVADEQALRAAFRGADVVAHLASTIIGTRDASRHHAITVGGTVAAFRAAVAAGARRFVHVSSIAAYGFGRDNPVGMDEDQPLRPTDRFFYARDKAQAEQRLAEEAAAHPEVEVFVVRPSGVAGPHALGAKALLPGPLAPLGKALAERALRGGRLPVPVPLPIPAFRLQLVHHDDVGDALRRCVVGDGPPGAYNVAAPDVLTLVDLAREVGVRPLPVPESGIEWPARAVTALPLPLPLQWLAAATTPAIVDVSRARERLGWTPRHSGLESWRATWGEAT
jgi:nucleoside-diphosphate-sugar epimerase